MKIGVYVQRNYAKRNYKNESYNVRSWFGLEMIRDVLVRAGYSLEYTCAETVNQYNIILVSITSDCDWWAFIAEHLRWPAGKYRTIIGGAGVLNIRPFLEYADAFVFGRGEDIILPLIERLADGEQFEHESVGWSNTFSMETIYKIAQRSKPYPHTYIDSKGHEAIDGAMGCPNACYFCAYSWHRRYEGDGTYASGEQREFTMRDLLNLDDKDWPNIRLVGLDGVSERLRFSVNKKISRAMFREFVTRLLNHDRGHRVKIYSIVGLPGEQEGDYRELLEDIKAADSRSSGGNKWSLLFHFTPFRAMPCTPARLWPMNTTGMRGAIATKLKSPDLPGGVFYRGKSCWCGEDAKTEGPSPLLLSAIILRGTEKDAPAVRLIARSPKFWASSGKAKKATIQKYFDIPALCGAESADGLATRNLTTYRSVPDAKILEQ